MDYDFEAFAQKIVANKNTVSNANKQAADTMTSVGIGNIGGSTTTTSAQQVQNNFFRDRDRDRNRGGSTYDEVPQTLTQGLGAPTKPPVGQEEEDEGGISSYLNNIASWFNINGADPKPKPPVSGASIYDRDEFKPISYDPTTNTTNISGVATGVDMRSSDEIMADIDAMLDRSDDTSYKNVYESTYDEVPQSLKGVDDFKAREAMTEGINNTIKGIMEREGKDYKDMKDTINNTIKGIMESTTGLTETQAALRKGLDKIKDGESFEVADNRSLIDTFKNLIGLGEKDPTGFEGMGPSPDEGTFEGMNQNKIKTDFVDGYLKGHEGVKAHASLEGGKDTAAYGVKNSLGLKRSDYKSDRDFAAAVALKHYNSAKDKFTFDFVWDELGEAGRYAMTDLHYNVGGVGSSAVKGTAKEAMTNTLNYIGMTTKDGTKASLLSLSKRRAENWNKAADDLGLDKVDKIQQMPRAGGGTIINYLNKKGDVIHQVSSGRKPITLRKNGTYKELTETKEVKIN